MTRRIKLTRKFVEAAEAPTRIVYHWDSEVVGLGLKITTAGLRTYILQYRFGGRARRYTIGAHGSPWTPETARDRARVLQGQVAAGVDPQEEKAANLRALTVAQLCDLYLAEGLVTRKDGAVQTARSRIEGHIKPLLGTRRASLVTRQDVEKVLRDVADGKTARMARTGRKRGLSRVRGGRGAANAVVVQLSAIMSFAVGRKVREDNPAYRVRRFPSRKIERFLSPAELIGLGEVIAAAEALGVECPNAMAALRLLILTGCRKSEILTLQRGHIDHFHRCLRLPDSKTGAKVTQIGAAALRVINAIPETPGNPYLLVGRDGEGHLVNIQKPWERIRAAAGLEDVRIHDLRHAFASLGVGSGHSLVVVGALLGHRSPKTTDRYAHLADHPVKEAAERISAEVARLMDGIAPSVDPALGAAPEGVDAPAAFDPVLGQVRQTRWLDTRAAAACLGTTVGTLQTYRWMGTGPVFRKIGRRVVYAQGDVDAWREARGQEPPPAEDRSGALTPTPA